MPRFQYISDLHVDRMKMIPTIIPKCDYLCICGDVGKPDHPNFKNLFQQVSRNFKKTFFVAGNHEYDCSSKFNPLKVKHYTPIIRDICESFDNKHFLDQETYRYDDNLIIAGTTLWSQPIYSNFQVEHQNHVNWIQKVISETIKNQKIVMMTHFVPTFKLIEEKYQKLGIERTSWFATDLEYLMKPPIVAWLAGHSHSTVDCTINDIYCGINACQKHHISQFIDIEESL